MPVNLPIPSQIEHVSLDAKSRDIKYNYPKTDKGVELDLRPGTELHNRIVNAVVQRSQDSYNIMKRKHPDWNLVDQTLTAYIPLDEKEKALKARDPRKPVSIVVPYTYATMETLLTYLVTAFLDLPIFRYEGVTSDDTVGAIMLEKVVELQTIKNKVGLALHTQFRDGLAYGFGAACPLWGEHWGYKTTRVDDKTTLRTRKKLFEGNRLENIDPYLFLPDITVPIHKVQDGESFGYIDRTNYMSLREMEATNPEDYFNVKYLSGVDGISTWFGMEQSKRDKRLDISTRTLDIHSTMRPVDILWRYMKLVPSDPEWQLGDSEVPEKWLFGIAADQFVIYAKQLGLDHDMFPVTIFAPDFDGYSVAPISRLELIYGMQNVLDFLFSSHVTNIRKAINDMLIVDPMLVNMEDLKDPEPGKLIRMRRAAWGRGVKDAVAQLNVNDITRSHISQDAPHVIDLMQRTSAAVDSLMGIMRSSGERRSATEARDSRMSALSRIAKTARLCSMMSMYDLAYMFASQTQQLMTQSTYVSTMGRYQQELTEEYGHQGKGMKVNPEDIDINYDTVIHDGSVDVGERADAWSTMFQILASQPAIGVGFDMIRVFKHIARMLGAKNVNDFIRKGGGVDIKTMQTEEVMQQVKRGNMVPVDQGLGGEGGTEVE
jgi:hypothetical protein